VVINFSESSIFIPLIEIEAFGGDFIIPSAILTYSELPPMQHDSSGVWLFYRCAFHPAINMKPYIQ
jgi:hypothetical protein